MDQPGFSLGIAGGAWLLGTIVSVIFALSITAGLDLDLAQPGGEGSNIGRSVSQLANDQPIVDRGVPIQWTAVFQLPLWLALIGAPIALAKGWQAAREHLKFSFTPADVGIGLLAGLGSQFVIAPLLYLALRPLIGTPDVSGPARALADSAQGWGLIVFVIMVVIVAPIAEELFFRGLVQGQLAKLIGPIGAIVVSALIFGAIHFQLVQFPALFAFGVVLAYLFHRYDRLGPAIVAHMAFNGATVLVLIAL